MRITSIVWGFGVAFMCLSQAAAAETSCLDEIGKQKADILVKHCIQISPATHPPCNAANPCSLIRDEVKRGCDMFATSPVTDDKGNVIPVPAYCKSPQSSNAVETRCGWFSSQGSGLARLDDRDGTWTIGSKNNWPTFTAAQWVEADGDTGYGCTCMKVETDAGSHLITRVESASAKGLDACRNDKSIKHKPYYGP